MFPERLKQCRLLHGLTLQKMADILGISMRGYQYYESGSREPNLDTLILIADTFKVSTDWLLGRDDFLESLGVSFDESL